MREISNWFGLSERSPDADIVVLGCPFDEPGSIRQGAADAPAAIRRWSTTAQAVTEDGTEVRLRVHDCGDVAAASDSPQGRWEAIEAAATAALASSPTPFLLGLGGDHAVTPPLVAAARQFHEDLAFLIIDAHPDAFDRYAGNEYGHATVLPRLWDRVGIEPQATGVAGVRSFGVDELGQLARAGAVMTARDWSEIGSAALADRIAEVVRRRPLYVSFDLDGLDPAHAPAVAYPVAGGPSPRELFDLLRRIFARLDVVAMDVVELTPPLDSPAQTTSALAAHICLQVLGFVQAARDAAQPS